MATRIALLREREDLHVAIRASEDWTEGYKQDAETFKALLLHEARLETAAAEYFHALSERAELYVDWSRLPEPVRADNGPVINNDDPHWKMEETILASAVLDILTELVATGAIAGEQIYGISMGYSTLHEAIIKAASTRTATLVKGVTETTRDRIRQAVRQSIAIGEDLKAAKLRLADVIDDPARAQLIAQTESVNGYQLGLNTFAKDTNAKSKTWDGLAGACAVCSPVIGKTVKLDKLFTLGNGRQVEHPSGHPRCRCSVIYNY